MKINCFFFNFPLFVTKNHCSSASGVSPHFTVFCLAVEQLCSRHDLLLRFSRFPVSLFSRSSVFSFRRISVSLLFTKCRTSWAQLVLLELLELFSSRAVLDPVLISAVLKATNCVTKKSSTSRTRLDPTGTQTAGQPLPFLRALLSDNSRPHRSIFHIRMSHICASFFFLSLLLRCCFSKCTRWFSRCDSYDAHNGKSHRPWLAVPLPAALSEGKQCKMNSLSLLGFCEVRRTK